MLVRGVTAIAVTLLLPFVAMASPKIYWTTNTEGIIRRADLDGSNVEDVLVPPDTDSTQTDGPLIPHALALDVEHEHIYWTEANPFVPRRIRRADMNGENIIDLVTELQNPTGIALDVAAGKMYWADAGALYRSNLDGTAAEPLNGDLQAYDIKIDVEAQEIYLVGGKGIWRVQLDGTAPEFLGPHEANNSLVPYNIDLDPQGGKMYLLGNGAIWRANLDGTSRELVLETGQQMLAGLAYDPGADQIYWGQGNNYQGFALSRICGQAVNFAEIAFNPFGATTGIALDLRRTEPPGDGCTMDLHDVAFFQRCFWPESAAPGSPLAYVGCKTFDFDGDGKAIDLADFEIFRQFLGGP